MSSEVPAGVLAEVGGAKQAPLISVTRLDALVGNTPMVKLRGFSPQGLASIYVKMENVNPSGTMRDRYIAEILQRSVAAGHTMPGDAVALAGLDDSALAAALLGSLLGFSVHLFVPKDAGRRQLDLITRYGPTLHWLPAGTGLREAMAEAAAWARPEPDRLYVDAFRRQAVCDAYQGIATEIMLALRGHTLGGFATSVSTGGTFREVSAHLRQTYPALKLGGAVLLEDDTPLESLRTSKDDMLRRISLDDAWGMRDRVAQTEGLLLGPKGAAAVILATEMQQDLAPDDVIVALNPDAGQRYLGWEERVTFQHQPFISSQAPKA